jgi:hypothetical protein
MKVKLIKVDKGYYNLEDEKGNLLGTSYQFKSKVGDALKYKLSKQNCDYIFGVVDVDNLAEENTEEFIEVFDYNDGRGNICRFNNSHQVQESYIKGFNKAMELNKDKLFTLHDMKEAYGRGFLQQGIKSFNSLIQSLQQPTEIEVRIAMGCSLPNGCAEPEIECTCEPIPSLDENGCLILWVLNT